jgi:hypothetical protein
VQQQLAQLTAIVDGLVERDRAAGDRLAAIEDERDRYRAEAAAAKEVALRVNAAAREAGEGTRKLLEALELQADALSQFLAPGSPADLLDR